LGLDEAAFVVLHVLVKAGDVRRITVQTEHKRIHVGESDYTAAAQFLFDAGKSATGVMHLRDSVTDT
jgi:hypothetical protein